MRRIPIIVATIISSITAVACGVAPEDDDVAATQDELLSTSADGCTARPWQPLGVCHVWRRDELKSIGCPLNKGRGWREWSQSGCSYLPGGVCERGEPRRQLREEASLPWCSR